MEIDEKKSLTINIKPGSIFKGFLIILLFWFLFFIKDIVLVVLVSIVLASGLEPLIHWFRKLKIKRLPAAIISYVIIFGLLGFPSILDEASTFLSELPTYFNSTTLWNPLGVTGGTVEVPQKIVQGLQDGINGTGEIVRSSGQGSFLAIGDLINNIKNLTGADSFVKIVSIVFGGILSFILIIIYIL